MFIFISCYQHLLNTRKKYLFCCHKSIIRPDISTFIEKLLLCCSGCIYHTYISEYKFCVLLNYFLTVFGTNWAAKLVVNYRCRRSKKKSLKYLLPSIIQQKRWSAVHNVAHKTAVFFHCWNDICGVWLANISFKFSFFKKST